MPIRVSVKHGDIVTHQSMIDALFDYQDCIDEPGVDIWWISDAELELLTLEDELSVLNSKDRWTKQEHDRYQELKARITQLKKENH